jgi:simple sugar transport system permease protein
MKTIAATGGTRTKGGLSIHLGQFALIPVLIVVFIVGALVHKAFLTPSNIILNILQQSAVLSLLVIAESLILISNNFDLSLESIVGLAPMVAAWLICPVEMHGSGFGLPPLVALLVLFAIGALIGALNGLLVVKLRLNAFIVTLAVLILLRGITLGVTKGATLFNLPREFVWLGSGTLLQIPISVWVAVILFILTELFLKFHHVGRAIYAIGGNAEAARAAGIRIERIQIGLYIVGGMLAALAGLMLSGRMASVTAGQGQNLIFNVMAAAVIGGISLNGGRGNAVGAFTGVLLLGTVSNILILSQIPSFWIDASFGLIIVVALLLSRLTSNEKGRDLKS